MHNSENLVLIAGFGAPALSFWSIMKPLAERYHFIMIEQFGMGGSARVPFTLTGLEETMDFTEGWF